MRHRIAEMHLISVVRAVSKDLFQINMFSKNKIEFEGGKKKFIPRKKEHNIRNKNYFYLCISNTVLFSPFLFQKKQVQEVKREIKQK